MATSPESFPIVTITMTGQSQSFILVFSLPTPLLEDSREVLT